MGHKGSSKNDIGIHAVMLPDGKHLADLEKKKMALNKEIGKLLDQSFKENDYTKYDSEFKRLSDELSRQQRNHRGAGTA